MKARAAALATIAALALLVTGCSRKGPDWRVLQLYGGQGSVEALQSAARVEAFRVDPAARPPEPGVAYVGVHRVSAGPDDVPAAVAAELGALLADAGTYDWRHAKGDPYRPTYGLRFSRDVSKVDIALDLESRMLTIHRHGKRIGVEDFDAAAPQIAAALAGLFPTER